MIFQILSFIIDTFLIAVATILFVPALIFYLILEAITFTKDYFKLMWIKL